MGVLEGGRLLHCAGCPYRRCYHIPILLFLTVNSLRPSLTLSCFVAITVAIAIAVAVVGFPGTTLTKKMPRVYFKKKISAGMGDAGTEAELAVLLSSLSPGAAITSTPTKSGTANSSTRNDPGTAGSKLEDPEVDFHDFVRLFRGVF